MAESGTTGHNGLVVRIIGGDAALYRRMLAERAARPLHLLVLAGGPSAAWAEMAGAALDSGYLPAEVLQATMRGIRSWCGLESAHLDGQRKAWEQFREVDDPRVREMVRLGIDLATRERDEALKREHQENVYGQY